MNAYPIDLACRILDLLDGELVKSQLDDIARLYVGNNRPKQIMFLNKLYTLLDNLPISLWDSKQQRHENLKIILQYVDGATMRQMGSIKFKSFSNRRTRRIKHKLG